MIQLVIRYIQKCSSLEAILQPAHRDHHNAGTTTSTAENVWKLLYVRAKWSIVVHRMNVDISL